jgi:hypothetical protein
VSLSGQLRRVFGRRRHGTALVVRVGPPAVLPPPRPRLPRALPPPAYPLCPSCRTRHPRTLPPAFASWATSLLPDPGRAAPLGRGHVDDTGLQRDRFNPWRL